MRKAIPRAVAPFACATALAVSASAAAQTTPPADTAGEAGALEDIVVTAQHRSENVQTTPLSVAALGGDELAARRIDNVQALAAAIPNVNFGTYNGAARVSIRGIGDDAIAPGAETRVAFHLDGIYLSRPQATMVSFFDIDRIEVVRGPQGTLYGRNATAGAINVLTRNPGDTLDGRASVTVGNYDLVRGEAAVGGPVAPGLSARVAGQFVSRGGYGRNIVAGGAVDDEHSWAVRGKLKYQFGAGADLVIAADHAEQDDHSGGWHYLGPGSPDVAPFANAQGGLALIDTFDTSGDVRSLTQRETTGVSATLSVDLGGADLTSITGYRSLDTRTLTDYDMTDLDLALYDIGEHSRQFSQEVRLQGRYGRGSWLVGGYYFRERNRGSLAIPLDQALYFGPPGFVQGYYIGGDLDTDAYAIFGQADVEIAGGVSLVIGGRFSSERKAIDEGLAFDTVTPFTGTVAPGPLATNRDTARWNNFTPRVSLEYKPDADLFFYATWAKGFKSGGFNLGGLQPPFDPEKMTNYEAGIKAEWFNRRLRTNISLFRYDYSDLQVTKVVDALIRIENAARATLHGAEIDVTAVPVLGLELGANVALLHSEYTAFDTEDPARPALGLLNLRGNRLNQSPDYSIALNAQYTAALSVGELTFRAEGYFVGDVYFTPFNLDYVGQAAYEKYNLFLTFAPSNSGWSVQGFVRNVGDRLTKASSVVGSGLAGFPISGSYDPPRTWGVAVSRRF